MTPEAAVRMLRQTGASAVMVARGSYGNPWLFGRARRLLAGLDVAEPTIRQRLSALECHVRLLDATGAHMVRARSICGWYLRGLPHAASWRDRAMGCSSPDDFLALVDDARARLGDCEGNG
jgi:tRNA-dihydrouridine synthase